MRERFSLTRRDTGSRSRTWRLILQLLRPDEVSVWRSLRRTSRRSSMPKLREARGQLQLRLTAMRNATIQTQVVEGVLSCREESAYRHDERADRVPNAMRPQAQ